MEDTSKKGSGVIIGIVVVLVVLIIGWLAYNQGLFDGREAEDANDGGVNIELGGDAQ